MRASTTVRAATVFVAAAIGAATLPAIAQTPPAPSGAGADLVGGADPVIGPMHPYGDLGVGASDSSSAGDILSGGGLDWGAAGVAPAPHHSETGAAKGVGAKGVGAKEVGAKGGDAKGGGMSAEEYADHLDGNAQKWDDLADQAADPADAARWRRHAADLRAEAARAKAKHEVADAAVPASDGDDTETASAAEPVLHYGTVEEGLLGPPDERIVGDLPGARGHLLSSDPENRGYEAFELAGYIVFSNFFDARYRSLGLDDEASEEADTKESRVEEEGGPTVPTGSIFMAIREVEAPSSIADRWHESRQALHLSIDRDLLRTRDVGRLDVDITEPDVGALDSGHHLHIEAGPGNHQ